MSRDFYPGMGQAVAERTILRKKKDRWETWGEVANRVAQGNSLLAPTANEKVSEYKLLKKIISEGKLITSGRHLQHGDITQVNRNMEVFTNCSTAITSFGLVYLLLNGSGVGRCYDQDLMLVNWDNAPNVLCVLDDKHPDFDYTLHETPRSTIHKYDEEVIRMEVEDSREGWAKAVEKLELLTFEKIHRDKLLILDFSKVRAKNSPIGGMQGRPSSGPVPLMNAFGRINSIKGARMPRWKQAMYIDHYLAEVVMMGGVRRSARWSGMYWKDPNILDFIRVKRPVEFDGLSPDRVLETRTRDKPQPFLWSSNNSVMVDQEFWNLVKAKKGTRLARTSMAKVAKHIFRVITECAYYDGTGEPGLVNVDKLVINKKDIDTIKGRYFSSRRYELDVDTDLYLAKLLAAAKNKQYCQIVNPCSEITIAIWGAFCTIADVCFYHCDTPDDCEEVVRATVRFLIRVNTLDSVYNKEVKRTNRIGVGLTGVHEAAWKFFAYDFWDLIDEEKSQDWWNFLSRMKRAIQDEAISYSKKLGVTVPHTDTTIKPSGSVSKLFGLTEGWHLPSMAWYLRWVQFSNDSPLVSQYEKEGYPIKRLTSYKGTTVVGFPTVPLLCTIMPPDRVVTATMATPAQQYKWLMLGEKYWIRGVDQDGAPLKNDTGNQISYTLKYDPTKVSYKEFRDTLLEYQSQVKCCSVMPQEESSGYEYLPEQPVPHPEYLRIVAGIRKILTEDVGREHLDCGTGGCPVDFKH